MWIIKIFIPNVDNYIETGRKTLESYKFGFILILILAIALFVILFKYFKIKLIKALIVSGVILLLVESGIFYKAVIEIRNKIEIENQIGQSDIWN